MKKETLEIKRYLLNPFSSHFLLGKDSKSPCFTVNLHARSSLLIIVTGIFLLPLSGKQGPLLKKSLLSVYRPEKLTYKFFSSFRSIPLKPDFGLVLGKDFGEYCSIHIS